MFKKTTSAKRDVNKSFRESFVMVKSKPKKAETFLRRFPLFLFNRWVCCSTVGSVVQPSGLLFNRQVFPTVKSFVQPSGFSNRQVLIFMFTNQGSG